MKKIPHQTQTTNMKKLFDLKINSMIVVFVFLFLVLGCQPPGGELQPVQSEGVEIVTSRFENDTAVINDGGLSIKLYGDWDGRAKVRVIVENTTADSIKMVFSQFAVIDSKGSRINIDSISEDKSGAAKQLDSKEFLVARGQKHKFLIGFPLNLMSSLGEDPPQIISVIAAIEVNFKTKELRKYKFDFKGIGDVNLSGEADPEI